MKQMINILGIIYDKNIDSDDNLKENKLILLKGLKKVNI